jgi:transposase-like protein
MTRKRYSPEQIIVMLREAEVLEYKGLTQLEIAKQLGICDQTLIRWRKEYGGLRVDQAKRLKELEKDAEMRPGQMPPPPEKPGTGMTFNELRDYAAKERREREDY